MLLCLQVTVTVMTKKLFLFFILSVTAAAGFAQFSQHTPGNCNQLLPGYYFLTSSEGGGSAMVLDSCGNVVLFSKDRLYANFSIQPGGLISFSDEKKIFLADSSFTVVDSVACHHTYETNRHDFQLLPDGQYLLLGSDTIRMDLSDYVFKTGERGTPQTKVLSGVVQLLDAEKNLLFEWNAKDHFRFADADTFFIHYTDSWIDWTHFNSVEMDTDGNIIISVRHFNEIVKVNRKDGSVMWRLGGKRNEFKTEGWTVPFYGQHDVRRISNGHLTFLDNGVNTISHRPRAMEFELDEDGKTARLVWSCTYDSAENSSGAGNVQRLDNGSTLVDWGRTTKPVGFTIIDTSCHIQYVLPGIRSYRVKYIKELPWKVVRPQIVCFDSLGTKYLKTAAHYSSYMWSDSSTTPVIRITKPGSYFVFVPYGSSSGFVSSESFIVQDVTVPCNQTIHKRKNKRR